MTKKLYIYDTIRILKVKTYAATTQHRDRLEVSSVAGDYIAVITSASQIRHTHPLQAPSHTAASA
jgi:hypothetical protein